MFKKFEFPDCLVDNVRKIESSIDITLVREVIQGKPKYLEWMSESEELRNLVVSDIPKDFDELEKAYYIYYKLCRILIYDYLFFTKNQTMRYLLNEKYKSRFNISRITDVCNEVVCYEWMAVYLSLIDSFNILFDVDDGMNRGTNVMYPTHQIAHMFLSKKYYVEVDPLYSVLNGDLARAKENRDLKGFECLNDNEQVKKDFKKSIDKVNEYIRMEEQKRPSFFDVINAYKSFYDELDDLKPEEKLSIIVNSIAQTDLSLLDMLIYINELCKMLFDESECSVYYILDHQRDFSDDLTEITIAPEIQVVVAYKKSIEEQPVYFLYSPLLGLVSKTQSELQASFDTGRYEYLLQYRKDIPNIVVPDDRFSCITTK